MASKAVASTALLLTFNLLFFTLVTSTSVPCPPPPKSSNGNGHGNGNGNGKSNGNGNSSGNNNKPPSYKATCPKDTLKLGVCANVLNGLLNIVVGTPPKTPCCSLIAGLVDLEAAICLCTAIKANVLGINLNVPLSLSLLLNYCGKKAPTGFQCA